jgi:RNA polymerase sigma-54 factor
LSNFRPTQQVDIRQVVRVDPSVVLRSKILALPQFELEQAIDAELADNPALERLDSDNEPISDEQVMKAVAPHEMRSRNEDDERFRCTAPDDQVADWIDMAATTNSLQDHVFAQLSSGLPESEKPLAWYLVASLNDRGYLDAKAEDIATVTRSSFDQIEEMLQKLHKCEPAGVGARSVTECLLLQLRDAETFEEKLAKDILAEFLDELVARRTTKISRKFKVLPSVVEAAFTVITELNPNPAEGFSTSPVSLMTSNSVSITPDLILRRTEFGWEIEPVGGDPTFLTISDSYRRKAVSKFRDSDPEVARHLHEYGHRAEQFLQCLKDRRRTLRQVGLYLVEHQASFVSTGQFEFLASLTRNKLAHDVGLHESTISRATMGKFVQIANGDIVPFEVFFKPALRIQKMIEEILNTENPGSPLSDEAIAKILESKGVQVARRTVNKYRDKTRMLNSRTRKSA